MLRSLVVAALLLGAGSAFAQTANAPGGGGQNASIGPATIPGATREDKLRYVREQLKAMDTNGDQRITSEEWTAAGGKKASFDALDYNKDNILTAQELRSNARKLKAFSDFQAAAPH
jgi:hypothetical protein